MSQKYDYEYFKQAADYVLSKVDYIPEIAIVLGSCLGDFSKLIENEFIIDYKDIPNFLISTAPSHAGKLILGEINGKRVVCMSGRFHYYEGYDFEQLVTPVRVFKAMGVKNLILTNAAGGINTDFKAGDIMAIRDHIKLMGASPVRGKNIEEFGSRFFDMSNAYDKGLLDMVKNISSKENLDIREGVYFYAAGPQFETPAEINAMRILGADAVGMSTVTEVITAVHCGIKVLALSLITNMAAGINNEPLTTEEVDETAKMSEERFRKVLLSIIREI